MLYNVQQSNVQGYYKPRYKATIARILMGTITIGKVEAIRAILP